MWDYPRRPHGRPWGRSPPDLRSDSCLVRAPLLDVLRATCMHACRPACLSGPCTVSCCCAAPRTHPRRYQEAVPAPGRGFLPFHSPLPIPSHALYSFASSCGSRPTVACTPHMSYANETSIRPSGVELAAQPRKGGDPKRDVSHMIGSSHFSILFHIRCETCGRLGGHMVLLAGELAHVPRAGALGIEA